VKPLIAASLPRRRRTGMRAARTPARARADTARVHERSSEGSDYRCKFDSNFDYDSDSLAASDSISAVIFLHGSNALTVVLNRTETATPNANIAGCATNLGIDRNEQNANSVCATSAAHQDTHNLNRSRRV